MKDKIIKYLEDKLILLDEYEERACSAHRNNSIDNTEWIAQIKGRIEMCKEILAYIKEG
jgi:hypothetical protein